MIISNKLYRLIDANINRAMEGIRVVEDVIRFVTDNKIITSCLKNLRSDLKKAVVRLGIPSYDLLHARSSGGDVGADLYSEGEARRADISSIITSNFKRVEESLRVLEESAKLIGSKFGRNFKSLRYKVYDLEKTITPLISHLSSPISKLNFDLYVIVDPEHTLGRPIDQIVKNAIKGGAKIIQLRDKKASKPKFLLEAKEIAKICRASGVTFIVNDHVDVAKAVDADGVHLGQDDISVSVARSILGEGKIIGASASNLQQSVRAEREGADYVGVGPIFPTLIKGTAAPVGLKALKKIKSKIKIPIVAIGGIDTSNIYSVRRAGIKKAAVIRAAIGERDVAGAVKALRRTLA